MYRDEDWIDEVKLTAEAAHERVIQGAAMQALEGSPFIAGNWAMFEMFRRERWSHERALARVNNWRRGPDAHAAE